MGAEIHGLAMLDNLNRRYSVMGVELMAMGTDSAPDPQFELSIVFGYYVNVPRLIRVYRTVPRAIWAGEGEEPGGDTETPTSVAPDGPDARRWRFTFEQGSGDCQAGCTTHVTTVVRYDRRAKTVRSAFGPSPAR